MIVARLSTFLSRKLAFGAIAFGLLLETSHPRLATIVACVYITVNGAMHVADTIWGHRPSPDVPVLSDDL
jgi:hypothetical protein